MNLSKTLAIAAVSVVSICAVPTAEAQLALFPEYLPGWSIVPAFQTVSVYENNLLFATESITNGTFLRLSPSLETRYKGPLGLFSLGYSFDSELHSRRLKGLDDFLARQLGAVTFESRPTTRSSISGRAHYMSTRRPEEVLDLSGLVAGQRRTTSFLASLAVEREVAIGVRARLGYTVNADDFGDATDHRPGARSTFHSLSTGLAFQRGPRTTLALEHSAKLLLGDELTTGIVTHGTFWANSVGFRWAHSLTPRVSALVTAGPRLAQTVPPVIARSESTPVRWELSPEALASLTYRTDERLLSLTYARTQYLGYGASGFINTDSLEIRAAYALGQRWRWSARPGVYRNSLAGLDANSYRLDASASYKMSDWMILDLAYGYRHQDRALGLADFAVTSVARSRTRNRAVLGMTLWRAIEME